MPYHPRTLPYPSVTFSGRVAYILVSPYKTPTPIDNKGNAYGYSYYGCPYYHTIYPIHLTPSYPLAIITTTPTTHTAHSITTGIDNHSLSPITPPSWSRL